MMGIASVMNHITIICVDNMLLCGQNIIMWTKYIYVDKISLCGQIIIIWIKSEELLFCRDFADSASLVERHTHVDLGQAESNAE